jgi:hypothetical protein
VSTLRVSTTHSTTHNNKKTSAIWSLDAHKPEIIYHFLNSRIVQLCRITVLLLDETNCIQVSFGYNLDTMCNAVVFLLSVNRVNGSTRLYTHPLYWSQGIMIVAMQGEFDGDYSPVDNVPNYLG